MNLQPLYDVKTRLEAAAVAGTGLLGEDFRLQRAAENLKPLAAASPVFGKIDAGLTKLLSAPAEARAGALLDTLALADAVAYTQAKTGIDGELVPLSAGCGSYQKISYGQISPLLTALTSTGGGRMEVVQSHWENHPEFFSDFRVLPAVIAGLGDSYGELAELNAGILKQAGPAALPLLKEGFDPAGKKEMARRVEVISALEGAGATPWLREILPGAKKDVRVAVLLALGNDPANTPLLLELAKTERSGGNREAVLTSLARQDGELVAPFWAAELKQNSGSIRFLGNTDEPWAAELVAAGLRERLENLLTHGSQVAEEEQTELSSWCQAVGKKDAPVMLDFWRWADGHMEQFDRFTNKKGNSVFAGVRLTDTLWETLRYTGPGPLRDFCLTLFDRRPAMTRYLRLSFTAALLSLPAGEVFEKYGPYILTKKPLLDAERKKSLNTVALRTLGEVAWSETRGCYTVPGGQPTAQPLDARWLARLTQAVYTDVQRRGSPTPFVYWENVDSFDLILMGLTDPADEAAKALLIPYARRRLKETCQPYSYSRWLFKMGASPRGELGEAMKKDPKANRIFSVWQLMHDAAQALPAGEVAALLEEVLASKAVHKESQPHLEKAVPWTVEQLKAGRPFPDMDDWMKLR